MQVLSGVSTCETDFVNWRRRHTESQQNPNVCLWHQADIDADAEHVRSEGESRHPQSV